MKDFLVSWLMPMYNNGNSARRAIDSMLAQTYTNFEIIIVLDPSNKETVSLCKEYESKDKRVHLIQNKERLGISGSLNVGLKNCKGKYIARMDADDYSYPDRLEKQVHYMEQHPEIGLLGGNARNIIEETKKSYIAYSEIPNSEEIKIKLLFGNCIMHPTIMFRAGIKEIQYPCTVGEDYALYLKLRPNIKMAIISDVIIDYYVSQKSASYIFFNEARKESCRVSKEAINYEFGINTMKYDNSLFGWRCYDDVYDRVEEFLCMHLQLFQEIIEKNFERKSFDFGILLKVLNQEWQQSLSMIAPYNRFIGFNQSVNSLRIHDIKEVFKKLDEELLYMKQKREQIEKIIVYGTGEFCYEYLKKREDDFIEKIISFCDSNLDKQGTSFFGKKVISPEELANISFDVVAIASPKYEEEIKEMLLEKGFMKNQIISLSVWDALEFHRDNNKCLKV